MANNETIPEREEAMVTRGEAAMELLHVFINGDPVTDAATESGPVPSLAKQARLQAEKVVAALELVAGQLAGAMIFSSVEKALLATPDEGYFSLRAAEDGYVDLYKNVGGTAAYQDTWPSADQVKTVSDSTKYAVEAAVRRSLELKYPWLITDELMKVILGIRADGVVDAILDRMPGLTLISDYAWVMTDDSAEQTVLLGVKWSGEVVINGAVIAHQSAIAVWEEGPSGQRDIWALVDAVPYQLTSSGDNAAPSVLAKSISYVERKGKVSRKTVEIPEPGKLADYIKVIWHIIFNGQSLQCGIGSGTPATSQPPAANRLLTLKDGVQLADETGVLSADMVAPFKPLVAKSLEPPALQVAAHLNRTRALPSDVGLLTSMHGRGGQSILSLNKGTIPYNNSLTAMTEAKAECGRLGYAYKVPFVSWNQGQHDGGWVAGRYLTALLQLQADYQVDIQAITGQTETIPLLLTQMSNWTAPTYKREFSNIPHEQLQAALENPDRFVMAGPQYWMPSNNDGIHLPASSYARDGVMVARAARAILSGQKWMPLHCVEAIRRGTVVELRFHVPSGPLVIDTVNVLDPGNYGIRWIDSAESASVIAVEQVGYDTLRVKLSAEPTGSNPQIGIADIGEASTRAGPTTGSRTCIRDSAPDLDLNGLPVFNWACHQRVAVSLT